MATSRSGLGYWMPATKVSVMAGWCDRLAVVLVVNLLAALRLGPGRSAGSSLKIGEVH